MSEALEALYARRAQLNNYLRNSVEPEEMIEANRQWDALQEIHALSKQIDELEAAKQQ